VLVGWPRFLGASIGIGWIVSILFVCLGNGLGVFAREVQTEVFRVGGSIASRGYRKDLGRANLYRLEGQLWGADGGGKEGRWREGRRGVVVVVVKENL